MVIWLLWLWLVCSLVFVGLVSSVTRCSMVVWMFLLFGAKVNDLVFILVFMVFSVVSILLFFVGVSRLILVSMWM